MKTKISHLLALLTLAATAVLIENAFLQSMAINDQAHDLMAKTVMSDVSPQNFNLLDKVEKSALADAAVPLFPQAKKLTFGESDSARYLLNASSGKVASFYNQIMALNGWSRVENSSQGLLAKENLDRVIIALAENPITKKTEAIFYNKPVSANEIFSVLTALAEEADSSSAPVEPAPQPITTEQPQSLPPTSYENPPAAAAPADGGSGNANVSEPSKPSSEQSSNMPQPSLSNNAEPQTSQLQFVRPDNGGNNNFSGPSEEDRKKMDEQRLKDMKRGMAQFTRSIKMMKSSVAKNKSALSKCGVGLPEELTNALNSADGLVGKINGAKTADELDEVMDEVQDIGSVVQDWGPRLGDLNRLCQMFKQADRDLKQLDRSLAAYQKKNSAKLDLSEILAEYKTNVEAMRQALIQAKELAKTDPDEALSKLEDDFYGSLDNVRNSEQAISMVLNISQGIRQATSDIKRIDASLKALKKKKLDISAIEELSAQFKQQMEEIKAIIKTKFDAEELIGKVEEAFETREQLTDNLQEYGIGGMAPQIKENKGMNVKVNLPDAFKKQAGGQEDEAEQRADIDGAKINNQKPINLMPKI